MDWRVKVAIQAVLARLPGGWRLNHRFQDLRSGHCRDVLRRRLVDRARELAWAEARGLRIEGADLLEIGTGRSPVPTFLMALLGPSSIRTMDRRPLLDGRKVAAIVRELPVVAEELAEVFARPPRQIIERAERLARAISLDAILNAGSIHYKAPGDATATGLAAASLDGIISYDVLEHLPSNTFHQLNAEARRILRPEGMQFHVIGLGDHYASSDPKISSVHFLRFSDPVWNALTGHELSYHNRLRVPEFLDEFARDGFVAEDIRREVDSLGLEALKTLRVDSRFGQLTPAELATNRAALLLRSAVPAGADRPSIRVSAGAS